MLINLGMVGNDIEESISQPQLSNTICFSIGPGAANQTLHRDDDVHHHHLKSADKHEIGRDVGVGLFVAGKQATKSNGATRFIPGSHLWDYSKGPPHEEQTVYAEMQPGDILANPIEAIRALPEWLQERVGFGLSRPFMGWVD
ncbi:phytanoyl- dioxygenase family protein [Penicillium malachiteum]|nr:phytanoyl- dioxygenase family protein [Penicillium malachiteum]